MNPKKPGKREIVGRRLPDAVKTSAFVVLPIRYRIVTGEEKRAKKGQ